MKEWKIYISNGKKRGYKLKVMSKPKAEFKKRMGNPDAIIIFTNTVSHKMVLAAEVVAKKNEVPVYKCHTSSQFALESIFDELEEEIKK